MCDECFPADGASLPGLCVLLQVGQTLLQGTRRFPAGQFSFKHTRVKLEALGSSRVYKVYECFRPKSGVRAADIACLRTGSITFYALT